MKMTNCYKAIIDKIYRIALVICLAVFTAGGTLCLAMISEPASYILMPSLFTFGVFALIIIDHLAFGAICAKGGLEIGFLKSAVNGIRLFKNAVYTDLIIRWIWVLIMVVLPFVLSVVFLSYTLTPARLFLIFALFTVTAFKMSLAITVGRHFETIYSKILIISLISFAFSFAESLILMSFGEENIITPSLILYAAVGLAGSIALTIFSLYDVNKALDSSFYY